MASPNLSSGLVGFPPLQHRALNNTYVSLLNSTARTATPIGSGLSVNYSFSQITALAGAYKALWVAPFAGTLLSATMVVDGAFITTSVVATTSIGGVAVTGGVMTIPNAGSGAGVNNTATPTAANTFTVGQVISVTVTGGVNAASGSISLNVVRTS
jgi:hypothetical protein